MKTEKEKMLAGELYDPLDEQLSEERLKARLLLKRLNDTREDEVEERNLVLKELIPLQERIFGFNHHSIVTMAAI